jgi:TPR repeat protein
MTLYEEDRPGRDPVAREANKASAFLRTDRAFALKELKSLAENGSILSMLYIADALNFYPVDDNERIEARQWYMRAYNAGSVSARYRLAELYAKAGDTLAAIKLYEAGVERGERRAAYWLGRTLFVDQKRKEEGKKLLRYAADNGHISAKMFLAAADMRGSSGVIGIPWGFLTYLKCVVQGFKEFSKDRFSTKLF